MTDRAAMALHYRCPTDGRTIYWADCSCGWETGFSTTEEDHVQEVMKDHSHKHDSPSDPPGFRP